MLCSRAAHMVKSCQRTGQGSSISSCQSFSEPPNTANQEDIIDMKFKDITLASILLILFIIEFATCSSIGIETGDMVPSTLGHPAELDLRQGDAVVESDKLQEFKAEVEAGKFEDAQRVYRDSNEETRKQCGGYLASLGYDRIVQFINSMSEYLDKRRMLGIVLAHADPELFTRILEEMKPGDKLLSGSVIGHVDLPCNPDRFMTVVNRITDESYREAAARVGADELFSKNKTECFDPMISALQGEASPNPNLANVAIQRAFWRACDYTDHRSSLAQRLHDHPAITARGYSNALYGAYKNEDPNHGLFNWLMKKADRNDLEKFISDKYFQGLPPENQKDVQNRYGSIKDISETRYERGVRLRRERYERIKDVLETSKEIQGHALPTVLINMVEEYDESCERRGQLKRKRQEKVKTVLEMLEEFGRSPPSVPLNMILGYDIID